MAFLCLKHKLCFNYLIDVFAKRHRNANNPLKIYTSPSKPLQLMLNQAHLKCFHRDKNAYNAAQVCGHAEEELVLLPSSHCWGEHCDLVPA